MAGQYAKPRSSSTEVIDGKTYNSFRGDNVNGMDLSERIPDPQRLLSAYFHSAATLNYCRALLSSEFADLHEPSNWNLKSEYWNLEHVKNVADRNRYLDIVAV
jgi:3-deoxy-7-phosphoheptulonate synthase